MYTYSVVTPNILPFLMSMICFSLMLNTLQAIFGFSPEVYPGRRAAVISGHFEMHVMVTKSSDFLSSCTIALASWKFCYVALGDPIKDDGRINLSPVWSISWSDPAT